MWLTSKASSVIRYFAYFGSDGDDVWAKLMRLARISSQWHVPLKDFPVDSGSCFNFLKKRRSSLKVLIIRMISRRPLRHTDGGHSCKCHSLEMVASIYDDQRGISLVLWHSSWVIRDWMTSVESALEAWSSRGLAAFKRSSMGNRDDCGIDQLCKNWVMSRVEL